MRAAFVLFLRALARRLAFGRVTPGAGAVLVTSALLAAGCDAPREPTEAERAEPGPVFILGFDGLTPALVDRFRQDGRLPNFDRLAEVGATGRIRSTIPMISPPAWTSVVTGVPPRDHGVWSFWIPEGDNPRGHFVDARSRLAPAIWEELTALGRTVGVVNVPISCPPDSVNGFQIAGFPYPEGAPLTWPAELEAEISDRGYLRDAWLGPPEPGEESSWLKRTREIGAKRREIGLDLLFKRRPDLSFIVFTTPDRVQHHLWKFHDPEHPYYRADAADELKTALRDVYMWCDEILGEVMGRLPPDATLFVVADHGFGPAYRGISKATILARAPGGESGVGESRNLFGGDFHLADSDSASRREFVTYLESVTDERGQPVARAVYDTRNDVGHGFGLELGPAIVAEEAEGLVFVPGLADGPLLGALSPTAFSGWHRRHGFFGAYGRTIIPGEVRDCDLLDIPAMTMHILGERVPRRYRHNFPRPLFSSTYFVWRPMVFSGRPEGGFRRPDEASEAGVDPAVREQLEALGYLDSN